MALFKVFRGPEEGLDLDFNKIPFHEGYVYFTEDKGNLYIDIVVDGIQKRLQVNSQYAQALRDKEDNVIEIDDIVLTEDIIDIEHGGTGAVNDSGARQALNVYSTIETDNSIDKVTTKSYRRTILSSGWVSDDNGYSYTINDLQGLSCGKSGDIPPIITYVDNLEEYSKIESAEATKATNDTSNGTIKFKINSIPNNNIDIIIIDNK